jgi:hypothetical protein
MWESWIMLVRVASVMQHDVFEAALHNTVGCAAEEETPPPRYQTHQTHRFVDVRHVHSVLQLLHHALGQLGGCRVGAEGVAQHLPVGGVLQQQPAASHEELLQVHDEARAG